MESSALVKTHPYGSGKLEVYSFLSDSNSDGTQNDRFNARENAESARRACSKGLWRLVGRCRRSLVEHEWLFCESSVAGRLVTGSARWCAGLLASFVCSAVFDSDGAATAVDLEAHSDGDLFRSHELDLPDGTRRRSAYVMLVGVFLLGDKAIIRDWIMIGCCAIGIGFILVMQLTFSEQSSAAWALGLGVLSGMLYAGVILSLRWLKNEDSAWLIALNHLVTALVMAPFALQKDLLPGIPLLLLLAAFGMFQMGLPYFLFATGLKTTPSHLASVIALLEPILLPVWIWVAWRHTPGYEPVPWWTMVGAGLILSGMLIRFVPWPGLSNSKSE
jgi:hypothetical protein